MCRKPIMPKKQDNSYTPTSTHPYTSSTQHNLIHNPLHENSYQEFPDTTSVSSPISQRSTERVSSSTHSPCFTRIGKALLLIGFVAVVMVFVIALL